MLLQRLRYRPSGQSYRYWYRYCPNLRPHAHFHDEKTGETHDIELPAAVLDRVKAILPRGYDAASVEIIFRGKAKS